MFENTNLWLKNLTNDVKEDASVEKLIRAYHGHQKDSLYNSIMDIITKANQEKFKEVSNMCEALEEILEEVMKEKINAREQQAISQGEQQKLMQLIHKKVMKGKSLEQIADELEETEESILPLYKQVKEELGK